MRAGVDDLLPLVVELAHLAQFDIIGGLGLGGALLVKGEILSFHLALHFGHVRNALHAGAPLLILRPRLVNGLALYANLRRQLLNHRADLGVLLAAHLV